MNIQIFKVKNDLLKQYEYCETQISLLEGWTTKKYQSITFEKKYLGVELPEKITIKIDVLVPEILSFYKSEMQKSLNTKKTIFSNFENILYENAIQNLELYLKGLVDRISFCKQNDVEAFEIKDSDNVILETYAISAEMIDFYKAEKEKIAKQFEQF